MKIVERKLQVGIELLAFPTFYHDYILISRKLHENVTLECSPIFDVPFYHLFKVGIHNGWTFVSKPHVVVLEPEYAGQVKTSKRASSMSSLKGMLNLHYGGTHLVNMKENPVKNYIGLLINSLLK